MQLPSKKSSSAEIVLKVSAADFLSQLKAKCREDIQAQKTTLYPTRYQCVVNERRFSLSQPLAPYQLKGEVIETTQGPVLRYRMTLAPLISIYIDIWCFGLSLFFLGMAFFITPTNVLPENMLAYRICAALLAAFPIGFDLAFKKIAELIASSSNKRTSFDMEDFVRRIAESKQK
ncbi:MAG: hypothetical protein K2X27_19790 [Candidatus Obscuribacterales bacterium]|nr:hypothetical protein [Candidatus Obscuribacterales bacterium]